MVTPLIDQEKRTTLMKYEIAFQGEHYSYSEIAAKKFLVISTVITLIGLLGIVLSNDLNTTRVIIFIAGLGFSNLFPVMFAIIVEQKPEYANELSGLIIFAVSGGALIPPIMGLLSDNFGVTSSIYVLIFCILYIAFAAYYAIKK